MLKMHNTSIQQRPELPTVTHTWHARKYKVRKLHLRYVHFGLLTSRMPLLTSVCCSHVNCRGCFGWVRRGTDLDLVLHAVCVDVVADISKPLKVFSV